MHDGGLITALHHFGLARDRLTAALGQAIGLNATEFEAVEHLEQDGPLTHGQLAERLLLTSGGMTQVVDRLERLGLVARRPHPADRRAVLLELNQAAEEQVPAPLAGYHAALAAGARRLSASERNAAVSFLEAVIAAAGQATDALRAEAGTRRSDRRGPKSRGAGAR